jgi:4-hydroxythreonine-4-phosphate dehydrogenase
MDCPAAVAQTVATAQACAGHGDPVVLAVSGSAPAASSRRLVDLMAEAAEPLLRSASTLVLTGGDTARSVLDRLGVERLQVLGELEPGICLSRDGARFVVTKAGGFGDSQSLVRVLRHLRNVSGGKAPPESKQ